MSESLLKCVDIEPLLDAFHDNELDSDGRKSVERHLSHCQACQAKLAEIERLVSCLRGLPPLTLERDLADSIPDLIESRKLRATNVLRPLAWTALGAAACATFVLIAFRLPSLQTLVAHQGHDAGGSQPIGTGTKKPAVPPQTVAENQGQPSPAPVQPERRMDGARLHKGGGVREAVVAPNREREIAASPISPPQAGVRERGQPARIATDASDWQSSQAGGGKLAAADGGTYLTAGANKANGSDDLSGGGSMEVATLVDDGHSTITDAIGLSTDEDGLYAIKM